MQKTLEYIAEVEIAAEDVLADRRQIVDLDAHRQNTRQAIRELHKDKTCDKAWLCFGNTFIRMPKASAKHLLEKDFNSLDLKISETHSELKQKVNKLRNLEHKDELHGFSLNPLSREEMAAVQNVL